MLLTAATIASYALAMAVLSSPEEDKDSVARLLEMKQVVRHVARRSFQGMKEHEQHRVLLMIYSDDDPAALGIAQTALDSRFPSIRSQAVNTLLWLARPRTTGIHGEYWQDHSLEPLYMRRQALFTDVLANVHHRDARVVITALRVLEGRTDRRLLNPILRLAKETDDMWVLAYASRLLSNFRDPRLVPLFLSRIADCMEDYGLPWTGWALKAMGSRAIPEMVAWTANQPTFNDAQQFYISRTVGEMVGIDPVARRVYDAGTRREKIGVLRLMRGRDTEAITSLYKEAAKSADAEVARVAREILQRYKLVGSRDEHGTLVAGAPKVRQVDHR